MTGPVLLVVEENAATLREIEQELGDRYARHYQVRCTRSTEEALARLRELAAAGQQVALILAGERLSGMSGSDLFDEARHLHPHAKRRLLIDWGTYGEPETRDDLRFDRPRSDRPLCRPAFGAPG